MSLTQGTLTAKTGDTTPLQKPLLYYIDAGGNYVPAHAVVDSAGNLIAPALETGGNLATIAAASGKKPVGAASLAASQASIGTSAGLIVAARTGVLGTARISLVIYNSGSVTVFFGPVGVTPSTGAFLPPGTAITLDTTASVYGVTSSGTAILGVTETF